MLAGSPTVRTSATAPTKTLRPLAQRGSMAGFTDGARGNLSGRTQPIGRHRGFHASSDKLPRRGTTLMGDPGSKRGIVQQRPTGTPERRCAPALTKDGRRTVIQRSLPSGGRARTRARGGDNPDETMDGSKGGFPIFAAAHDYLATGFGPRMRMGAERIRRGASGRA